MKKGISRLNVFVATSIVYIMIIAAILPTTLAVDVNRINGFDKGPSYTSVVPMEKVTFVNYDEESYLDDYAYLAAIPTSVFNDGDKLFSHPLLFYQDDYEPEDEKDYKSGSAPATSKVEEEEEVVEEKKVKEEIEEEVRQKKEFGWIYATFGIAIVGLILLFILVRKRKIKQHK